MKEKIRRLTRALGGRACRCQTDRVPVEFREVDAAEVAPSGSGPARCELCGRPLPVSFVEVTHGH